MPGYRPRVYSYPLARQAVNIQQKSDIKYSAMCCKTGSICVIVKWDV